MKSTTTLILASKSPRRIELMTLAGFDFLSVPAVKEEKIVDGKIYLSNGAIIKEGVVGKFFDIATNDKYGTVFEADGPDEIGPIVGFAPVTGDSAPDYFAF